MVFDNAEEKVILTNNNLSKNLSFLIKKNHTTDAELAKALNIPYNTIRRLTVGFTTDPRISTLTLIAQHFNVSIDALLDEDNPEMSTQSLFESPKSVPLFDWEDVSKQNFFDEINLKNWIRWSTIALAPNEKISNKSYALESKPSMQPRFPQQTIFIIDPNEKPIDGDLILIRFKSDNTVSLRDLIIDPPEWILLSISQSSKSINFDPNQHIIIGVVVLTILNARKK